MTNDLNAVEFRTKRDGDGKWPTTMAELVAGWIWYQVYFDTDKNRAEEFFWAYLCVLDLVEDHADLGWDFVLATLATKPDEKAALPVLAAGPLEDLLANHGSAIIERVEIEARRSPAFRHLLGGVWRNRMSEEIWQRVLKAAPNRW